MEDLVQHCMRELAFDGDFGCDVSRFRQFVRSFYESQQSAVNQKLDEPFYAYTWQLLVQQPSVHVGIVSKGTAAEVYIAPTPSKRPTVPKPKKKAPPVPAPFPALDINESSKQSRKLYPIPNDEIYFLTHLIDRYGADLRVAVNSETCFRAITGSHARPAKLTPMVYTALQLISRGREHGLSVVDLGKKTGYDQRTCFYLIQQLLALDLVVKLAQAGIGGNFCVHKYFYEHSEFWKGVHREAERDMDSQIQEDEVAIASGDGFSLHFDQIDSRHLASYELVKSRIVRLLKHSENGLHHYHNLLVKLGFSRPKKRDRRFFIHRIRELIKEKVIEKVIVPKGRGSAMALCIRLVGDPRTADIDGLVVRPGDEGDEEQDIEPSTQSAPDKDGSVVSMPYTNMTFQRQTLQLLEEAGSKGLTINNIGSRLGMFDKRTLELMLYRLERFPPPDHLAYLTLCDFIENEGRERRHRYYTLTGFLSFIRDENIEDAGRTARYTSINASASGGFYHQSDQVFYSDKAALIKYEREYRDRVNPPKEGTSRKIGRPRKEGSKPRKPVVPGAPRGRPKKVTTHEVSAADPKEPVTKTLVKRKRGGKTDQDVSDLYAFHPHKKLRGLASGEGTLAEGSIVIQNIDTSTSIAEIVASTEQHIDGHDASHTMEVDIQSALPGEILQPGTPTALPEDMSSTVDSTLNRVSRHTETPLDPALCSPSSPLVEEANTETLPDGRAMDMNTDFVSTSTKRTIAEIGADDISSGAPPPKRSTGGRPKRGYQLVNISQLRAENEILRVVEESGGIVNMFSKEFLETYTQVLSSMVAAGEPTSMPVGNQPDRRTIRKITDNLLERGRLKSLTVTLTPRPIQPRLAYLIYSPTTPQNQLESFITDLQRNVPILNMPRHKRLENHINFTGRGGHATAREDNMIARKKVEDWDFDVVICEDDETVHRRFLSEEQTVTQIYGYILGRVRRARELHQYTLFDFSRASTSSYIVSRTERIVAFPYYWNDIPISTYFAIVSALEHSTELSALMQTEEGRQTPVRDLPRHLREQFRIGFARTRSRLLDLLEILTELGVITALQPSKSASPYISCNPADGHPGNFDLAQITKSKGTVWLTETYWRFNTIAPIYIHSQSHFWPPPFFRDMLIQTADESMAFWIELEAACMKDPNSYPAASSDSITGPCICSPQLSRMLRRRYLWTSSYELSYKQRQYMVKKWTDATTGYTILSDSDGGRSAMERISYVISAPFKVVYEFFQDITLTQERDADRIRRRDQLRREELRGRQIAAVRSMLARKATDARAKLESDWEELIRRVHTGSFPYGSAGKVKELKIRYIQSRGSMSVQQWENEVNEAISGDSGRRNPVLPALSLNSRKRSTSTAVDRPTLSEQSCSVLDLIGRYKDKIPDVPFMLRNKEGSNGRRRQRFQWTTEYDELARDASAVIRARCRTWYRMDWTALDQLFPFLPRNNVRQRITTLKQEAGGESYLSSLEEKWLEVWKEHRGSEELPDPNPDHPSDFDAIAHVEFLRKHIDKRALRAGMSRVNCDHLTGAVLTEDVSEFFSTWVVREYTPTPDNMDFLWSSIGDDHREKTLLGEAFSIKAGDLSTSESADPISNGVAESALKMALSTRIEDYKADDATLFLGGVGHYAIDEASENLLARGVVSIAPGTAHRRVPGRNLKISELNEDALGGPFSRSVFVEACALEDALTEEPERDWNLLARDGEMAALIEAVSEGKIDFDIDTSDPAAYREKLDWNSKKVDDDHVEAALHIRYHAVYPTESSRAAGSVDVEFDDAPDLAEGHGWDGDTPVTCRKTTSGVITCPSCLKRDRTIIFARINPEQQQSCSDLLERLNAAGRFGLSYKMFSSESSTLDSLKEAAWILSSAENPLCYWLGYSHPVLVGWRHVKDWTVSIPGPMLRLVFPRRWINIKGEKMEEVWSAALRAVVGVLIIRPGISLAELRQKLVSVYDRQEVNDLLSYLIMEDVIVQHAPGRREVHNRFVYEIGGIKEQQLYLSIGTGAWYRFN